MTVLTMSAAEVSRFDTLMRLDRGEIRPVDAMALLGLQRSQLYRLLKRLRQDGAAGIVSRKRGRPSNHRFDDAFREKVVALSGSVTRALARRSRPSIWPSATASRSRTRRCAR